MSVGRIQFLIFRKVGEPIPFYSAVFNQGEIKCFTGNSFIENDKVVCHLSQTFGHSLSNLESHRYM